MVSIRYSLARANRRRNLNCFGPLAVPQTVPCKFLIIIILFSNDNFKHFYRLLFVTTQELELQLQMFHHKIIPIRCSLVRVELRKTFTVMANTFANSNVYVFALLYSYRRRIFAHSFLRPRGISLHCYGK